MSPADPQRQPARPDGAPARSAALSVDLAELQRLVAVLRNRGPLAADPRAPAPAVGGTVASTAAQHLRAITALLATLDTYLRGRRPRAPATEEPQRDRPAHAAGAARAPDAALAAAAACYIARDLAARRLSEFTSAEGYRLARTLARIGDVEGQVERLLAEANTMRLHPPPLTDAVSHKAG